VKRTQVAALGIVGLVVVCVAALLKSVDTTVVGVVCGTIGTIVGYMFGVRREGARR